MSGSGPAVNTNLHGQIALRGGSGGTGTSIKIADTGPITSGNITVAVGLPYTALGTALTLAAATGDYIGIQIEALAGNAATNLIFDAATRVAAADVNYFSSGNGTPLFNGARPPWYLDGGGSTQFSTPRGEVRYKVQAGDISGGNVTVQAYAAAETITRTVSAVAAFPLRVILTNYGPGT